MHESICPRGIWCCLLLLVRRCSGPPELSNAWLSSVSVVYARSFHSAAAQHSTGLHCPALHFPPHSLYCCFCAPAPGGLRCNRWRRRRYWALHITNQQSSSVFVLPYSVFWLIHKRTTLVESSASSGCASVSLNHGWPVEAAAAAASLLLLPSRRRVNRVTVCVCVCIPPQPQLTIDKRQLRKKEKTHLSQLLLLLCVLRAVGSRSPKTLRLIASTFFFFFSVRPFDKICNNNNNNKGVSEWVTSFLCIFVSICNGTNHRIYF